MISWKHWVPGGILTLGCFLNGFLIGRKAVAVPLRAPIESVMPTALGVPGQNVKLAPEVEKVTGMTTYVARTYAAGKDRPAFDLYVGYYDEQYQGHTIHSPKNCLPGAGWEPVEDSAVTFTTKIGSATVNRYRLARSGESAVVYYWYQGRGRVANNELRVKYELLRDAALHGRTEEALVRIVVRLKNEAGVPAADQVAKDLIGDLVVDVDRVLPKYP